MFEDEGLVWRRKVRVWVEDEWLDKYGMMKSIHDGWLQSEKDLRMVVEKST